MSMLSFTAPILTALSLTAVAVPSAPAAESVEATATAEPQSTPAPAPTAAPTPAPTAAPAPQAVEGPIAPPPTAPAHIRDIPPPPPRGTDALIIGGVAAGVGLVANINRIVQISGDCMPLSGSFSADRCATSDNTPGYIGQSILAPTSNIAAAILLGVGGKRRGVYNAHRSVYYGDHAPQGKGALISGALMLPLGIVGYTAIRGMSFADGLGAKSCGGDPDCQSSRHALYVAGIEASQLTAAAGAGLLGYGVGLRKGRRNYVQAKIQPMLSPTFAGVGISGRF